MIRDKGIGGLLVPNGPDEAGTLGMEARFRAVGIYSHAGQVYEPVDMDTLLYYKEASDGQILEEGITEAGSMSSFVAAGTAYATHGVNTIPFFIYYSMFGFQRIGDLVWAAGDSRTRGFMLGGTSGRTTLAGEGLQHQDGNSHLFAMAYPNCVAYDPAFAYEIAVIIRDGIRRMYVDQESIFYPAEAPRVPYVPRCLADAPGVFIAASDYVKALPDSIDRWLPRPLVALGTDGFGRSENRVGLREFFEVDYRYVVVATLAALAREGKIDRSIVVQAIKAHNVDAEKPNPAFS